MPRQSRGGGPPANAPRLPRNAKGTTREVSICYDYVRVAAELLGEPRLHLVMDNNVQRAKMDGLRIEVPKDHPRRLDLTKHELAHKYFKSNIPLRAVFVRELIGELERISPRPLGAQVKGQLLEDLCFFINVLDDIRVNSLFGLLYPGAGESMDEWYHEEVGPRMWAQAQAADGDDIQKLSTFAILVALGFEPESTTWGEFRPDIQWAVDQAAFKTFSACLVLTRSLVLKIAKRLAEEYGQDDDPASQPLWGGTPDPLSTSSEEGEEAKAHEGTEGDVSENRDIDDLLKSRLEQRQQDAQQNGMDRALKRMARGAPPAAFDDDNAGFDFKDQGRENQIIRKIASDLMRVDVGDPDKLARKLEDCDRQAGEHVRKIMQRKQELAASRNGNFQSEDGMLTKGVKARVEIVRPPKSSLVPIVLTPEEERTAERWRQRLVRVMNRASSRLELEGDEFAPEEYMIRRAANEPLECFRQDVTGRGFRMLILADMSYSMSGYPFRQVERLNAVLTRALDFPMVDSQVMGFCNPQGGVVRITIYPKKAPGLVSPTSYVDGATPIPQALQIAGRKLTPHTGDKHILLLSDGFPVYQTARRGGRKGRVLSTELLRRWTRDAVAESSRHSIRTWCFMMGHQTPPPRDMDFMFGPRRWKRLGVESVYEDAFSFITQTFVRYLTAR